MSTHPKAALEANDEQVRAALEALTDVQMVRLNAIARFRHRCLGVRGAGRNATDFLSDAVTLVLEGRRKWKVDIPFDRFLAGVMRSLASHARSGKPRDAFDALRPNPDSDERVAAVFDGQSTRAGTADEDEENRAGDLDSQIRESFREDTEALLVYDALLLNMKPADIQAGLGLTEKEYNAAAKRLRRGIIKMKGAPA